ncbi:MAG: hypothetical protein FJ009_07670 [Chloroflexi bacterium]|nr:hypothetical protein [Chloroflexota bacterium]
MSHTHLIIAGLVAVLLTTGCNSNDPLVIAEAKKREAEAEKTSAETLMKLGDWQLTYEEKALALQQQKAKDALQQHLDAIYGPIEREENLTRQWTAFWVGASVIVGLALLGAAIVVDRYRLARRSAVQALEAEIRQARAQRDAIAGEVQRLQNEANAYRAQARTELAQIRKEQRDARKQLAETQGKLLALQDQFRAEEEKAKRLRALNASLSSGTTLVSAKHPNNGDVDPATLPAAE